MQFLSATPCVLTGPHPRHQIHRFLILKSLLLTGLYTATLAYGHTAAGKIKAVSQLTILAQLSNLSLLISEGNYIRSC